MATFNYLLLSNCVVQERAVHKASESVQDLRNSIVRKHGDLIDIAEFSISSTFEASPEVCHDDLGSFEEPHCLPVLETKFISKAWKVTCQKVNQSSSRSVGCCYAVNETAAVFL